MGLEVEYHMVETISRSTAYNNCGRQIRRWLTSLKLPTIIVDSTCVLQGMAMIQRLRL